MSLCGSHGTQRAPRHSVMDHGDSYDEEMAEAIRPAQEAVRELLKETGLGIPWRNVLYALLKDLSHCTAARKSDGSWSWEPCDSTADWLPISDNESVLMYVTTKDMSYITVSGARMDKEHEDTRSAGNLEPFGECKKSDAAAAAKSFADDMLRCLPALQRAAQKAGPQNVRELKETLSWAESLSAALSDAAPIITAARSLTEQDKCSSPYPDESHRCCMYHQVNASLQAAVSSVRQAWTDRGFSVLWESDTEMLSARHPSGARYPLMTYIADQGVSSVGFMRTIGRKISVTQDLNDALDVFPPIDPGTAAAIMAWTQAVCADLVSLLHRFENPSD